MGSAMFDPWLKKKKILRDQVSPAATLGFMGGNVLVFLELQDIMCLFS